MKTLILYLAILLFLYKPNDVQAIWSGDIRVADVNFDLQAAMIFKDFLHKVNFSVTIVMNAGLGDLTTEDFQIEAFFASSDIDSAKGDEGTVTVDPSHLSLLNTAHQNGAPFIIEGSALILADEADTCSDYSHVCVRYSEVGAITDDNRANNFKCREYLPKCDGGWVDLRPVEFHLDLPSVHSGAYTTFRLRTETTATEDIPDYPITVFLSLDAYIDPTIDKQVTTLPAALTVEQPSVGFEDRSAAGLRIPDVGANPEDSKYCGSIYIGVMMDGTSSADGVQNRGVVAERDEWNNFMASRITIICAGDSFQASDFRYSMTYGQNGLFEGHSVPLWVNVTITTLRPSERLAVSRGATQFRLSLYLHDSELLLNQTDNTMAEGAIDLTGASIEVPDISPVLLARAPGERLQLENVEMWIDGSTVPESVGGMEEKYLHLVVWDAATSTVMETVLQNNHAWATTNLNPSTALYDALWSETPTPPTTPSRLEVGANLATGSFAGNIIYNGAAIQDQLPVYYSTDAIYDATDIASGITLYSGQAGLVEAVTVYNDDNPGPVAVPQLDASNKRFCGSIHVVVPIEMDGDVNDGATYNNAHVAPMVLVCHADDLIGLTDLWVTNAPVLWKGKAVLVTFTAIISCTAADCGTVTTFNIKVKLGTDVSTEMTITPSLSGTDFTDAGVTRITVTDSVLMTAPATACETSNTFGVILTDIDPGTDWTENNELTSPLPPFRCSATGTTDIEAVSITADSASVELGTANPFSFDVKVEVETTWYPQVEWPRFQFELYLSLDDQLEYHIPYIPTDCQRDELSKAWINGTNTFTLQDEVGFYLPRSGLERFCGQPVKLCVLLDTFDPSDTDDIKGQIDEVIETDVSNAVCTTVTFDQEGNCQSVSVTNEQKLAVAIIGDVNLKLDGVDVTAVAVGPMTFIFSVGVTNRHTQQLPAKADPGNFALTIDLAKTDDAAEMNLPFPSAQEVYQTLPINAGDTLVIDLEITATVAPTFCTRYEPTGVELRLSFDSEPIGYVTATVPDGVPLVLACTSAPIPVLSLYLPPNMAFYNEKTYVIPVTVVLTHHTSGPANIGEFYLMSLDDRDATGRTYDDAVFNLATTSAGGCKLVGTWTAEAQPDVDLEANTVTLVGTATFAIPATGCNCEDFADSGKLALIGVKTAGGSPAYSFPKTLLNGVTFPGTADNGVDIKVTADSDIGPSPLTFYKPMHIDIRVNIADVTGAHAYDLEIYFSHDNQLDEDGSDLKVATLDYGNGNDDVFDVDVPFMNYEAARFCQMNGIYVLVRAVTTVADFVDLNLLDNVYSQEVNFSCPGDLYRVDAVTGLGTTLVAGVTNKVKFSVTVTNDAMVDLPVTNRMQNFHLELEDQPAADGPRTSWSEGLHVTEGWEVDIAANGAATFTVEASRSIPSSYCSGVDTGTSNLRVRLFQDLGLGEATYDAATLNNYVQLPLTCTTTDFTDLGVGDFEMSVTTQVDTLVVQAAPTEEEYDLWVFLSRDATWDAQDTEVYYNTHTDTFSHTDLALNTGSHVPVYAPCQKVYYIAWVELTSGVDPDYTNNVKALEFTMPCTDVEDLYSIEATVHAQTDFTADMEATLTFSAYVRNLKSTPISAATADMMNFDFTLYAKVGPDYAREEMAEVAHSGWDVFGEEGARRYLQVAASPGGATFRQVRTNVTLTSAVCAMGVTHLFVGVESSSLHSECIMHNNYHAVPISCHLRPSHKDLRVKSDRNGGARFRFTRQKTVTLIDHMNVNPRTGNDFVLEVEGSFTGPGSGSAWRGLTPDSGPVFDVRFQLSTPDPTEAPLTVPHTVRASSTHTPVTEDAATVFVLNGVLFFSLGRFAHLCNQDNLTLTVTVDPDDVHMETDEYNNQAVITGLRIAGDEDDDKCDPTLPLKDWGVSGLKVHPHSRYAEYNGDQDMHLEFTLECRLRGVSPPGAVHLRLLLSEVQEVHSAGLQWEETGLNLVPVTATSSLYTAQVSRKQAIVPDMAEGVIERFCGRFVYLGLVINPDAMQADEMDPVYPNVDWIRLRLNCPATSGVGILRMDVTPGTLSPSSSAIDVNITLINKNDTILSSSPPSMAIYMTLRDADMANTSAAVVAAAAAPITLTEDWVTGQYVLFEFTASSALAPDLTTLCDGIIGARYVCISIGMNGDPTADDDEECFNVLTGPVSLDCPRDGVVTGLEVGLTDTVAFYQDADIEFTFNMTFTMTGHALPPPRGPQGLVTAEFYVSADAVCDPSADTLVGNWSMARMLNPVQTLDNGTEVILRGASTARILGDDCVEVDLHLCAHYVISPDVLPTYRDSDVSTDCVCALISEVTPCAPGVDIRPKFFGVHTKAFKPGDSLSFDLFVGIEKSEANITFMGGFYLSTDDTFDPTDTPIPYAYFTVDPARTVLGRNLPGGNHTLNLNGFPLVIPKHIITSSSLCGRVYILYYADIDNEVNEKYENNNVFADEVTLVCDGDLIGIPGIRNHIELHEFSFRAPEQLAAGRDSYLLVGIKADNAGVDLPVPSVLAPTYSLVLTAVDGTPTGALLVNDVRAWQLPQLYYEHMRSGQRHDFNHVKVTIPKGRFTKALCKAMTAITLCLIHDGDNVDDHCLTSPVPESIKNCQTSYLRDLTMTDFNAPPRFGMGETLNVSLEYGIHLGSDAIDIMPLDFRSGIYVTHDENEHPLNGILLFEVFSDASAAAGGSLWWRQEASGAPEFPPGDEYCGLQYLSVVVDSGEDILEPQEDNNHITKPVTIGCPNDQWSMRTLTFETAEGQLVENIGVSFTLESSVECVADGCSMEAGTDSVMFTVRYDNSTEDWFSITSTYDGDVSPSLDDGFRSGELRSFNIRGIITLEENACPADGLVYLTVFANSSVDYSETVLGNNQRRVAYPCSPGLRLDETLRDLLAYHAALPGVAMGTISGLPPDLPIVNQDDRIPFEVTFQVTGAPIPVDCGLPPPLPFGFAFFFSDDEELGPTDDPAMFELPAGVADVLCNLPQDPMYTVSLSDVYGFVIPPGRCGHQNLILHLDDSNRLIEASEDNNYAVTPLYVACEREVLSLDELDVSLMGTLCPGMATDLSISVVFTNKGMYPVSSQTTVPVAAKVYLSQDASLDANDRNISDNVVTALADAVKEQLMRGVSPGKSLSLDFTIEGLVIPEDLCTQSQYLIVKVEAVAGTLQVDADLSNNYRAFPLDVNCLGTDMSTTILDTDAGFKGQVSWSNPSMIPVYTATYRLWVSNNPTLERKVDWLLEEGSLPVTTSTEYTFVGAAPALEEALQTAPDTYCGLVYLVGEVDVYNEVEECDEDNNVITSAEVLKVCDDLDDNRDIMTHQIASISKGKLASNGGFHLTLDMLVHCYSTDTSMCKNAKAEANAIYFYFTLRLLDEDLFLATDMSPNVINDNDQMGDELDTGPKTIPIDGDFILSDINACERVRYLEVTLEKGSGLNIDLGPPKTRLVPCTFSCDFRTVDLSVKTLAGSVDFANSELTLELQVDVVSEDWPKNTDPDLPTFTYIIGVKSADTGGREIKNIGYVPSDAVRRTLAADLVTGTLTLSETTSNVDWDALRTMCGREDITLTVDLDVAGDLAETDEENNKKVADTTFAIEDCTPGIDFMLTKFELGRYSLSSGDLVAVDVDVRVVLTGSVGLLQRDAALALKNYDVTLALVNQIENPTEVYPLPYPLYDLPELSAQIFPVDGSERATIHDHLLNEMAARPLHIPAEPSICGTPAPKSWFVRVCVTMTEQTLPTGTVITASYDKMPSNNCEYLTVNIGCKLDQLALYQATALQMPDEYWSEAGYDLLFDLIITNLDADIPMSPGGLFKVNLHFSASSEWDPTNLNPNPAKLYPEGSDIEYRYADPVRKDALVRLPRLQGTVYISAAECEAATALTADPTLFVQLVLEPTAVRYSISADNDVLKISLPRNRLRCQAANVDLKIRRFELEGTEEVQIVNADTFTFFSITMEHTRTSSGGIPASNNGLSYNFKFCLSNNDVLDDTDHCLHPDYTEDQLRYLVKGINDKTPATIEFNGDNLMVDISSNTDLTFYCGRCHLFAKITDLKNTVNIDPNLENNYKGRPIILKCPGDVVAIHSARLVLVPPQRQFFSQTATEFYFSVVVNSMVDVDQPSAPGQKCYFRFFASPVSTFKPEDIEMDVLKMDVEGLHDPLLAREVREFTGTVKLDMAPVATAKTEPKYILVLFMLAGRQVESEAIVLNNYEVIPLHGLFNDTRDTDDLAVSYFELLSGTEYTLGIAANYSFVMGAHSTYSDDTTINRQLRLVRLVKIAVLLSRDEEVDDSDVVIGSFVYFFLTHNFTRYTVNIPGSLKPALCGRVFMIVMADWDDKIWEADERNNYQALPIDIFCPYDILEMRNVRVTEASKDTFFKSPAGISLFFDILPFVDLEPEVERRALSLLICARKPGSTVCHDVTPATSWVEGLTGDDVMFNAPLETLGLQSFWIKNHLDMTGACESEVEPLEDGQMELVLKMLPGDSDHPLPGLVDGVLENNMDVVSFKCQCTGGYIDFSVMEFRLGTHLDMTTQLGLDQNPFIFIVVVKANPVTIYNDKIHQPKPIFNFRLLLVTTLVRTLHFEADGTEVTATSVLTDILDYPTEHYDEINKRILPEDIITLSDTSGGFNLSQEAFFKLCLAESVSLGIKVDSGDDVLETDESNNAVSLVRLIRPNGTKCEGQDFAVKTFAVKGLSYNLLRGEQPLMYDLKVNTYLSGVADVTRKTINGLPSGGSWRHFDVWIFLSRDKSPFMTPEDDVLLHLELSDSQTEALKKSYTGYQEMALDGFLTVPINETTYPYCWTHISLGVFIRLGPEHRVQELTATNNMAFYDCIFDCGNALDECERGLHNCHSNATCEDRDYSYTDPRRDWLVNNLPDEEKPKFLCECNPGYKGNGTFCENIDECTERDDGRPLHNCHLKNNSKCVDTEGSFDCECDDGFESREDVWQGSLCIDIDECAAAQGEGMEMEDLAGCHDKAMCNNTYGSHQCLCKPGFSGNGTHCDNIDECQSDPCHSGGTCRDYEDGFWCECPQHYSGELCDDVNGNWGEWSTWSDCSPKCGNGQARRARACDNPAPLKDGLNCKVENDVRTKQMKMCYTDCDDPDPGSDVDDECSEGYHLVRRQDGSSVCDDIDECTPVAGRILHDCDSIGICTNLEGSYQCSCRDGFYMDGRFCKDINECASPTDNACDVNAECINTGGSYRCKCHPGYKQDDDNTGICIEDRLLPCGAEAGDTEVTSESLLYQGELVSPLICIPYGLPLFDHILAECLYITENGVIVATNGLLDTERKDPRKQPRDLTTLTFPTEQKERAIFAPWWADGEVKHNASTVWYQEHNKFDPHIYSRVKDMMEEMQTCHFSPDYMLKVTWKHMAPYYRSFDQERNTFQAVIATDNKHTCLIYLYDQKKMKWDPQERRVRPAAPPMVGYSVYSAEGVTVNRSEPLGSSIYRIDGVKLRPNVTNTTGIVSYRLDDNDDTYNNPRRQCLDWYYKEPDISTWGAELVGKCPHYRDQANNDSRFVSESTESASHRCFNLRFPLDNGADIRCCYDHASGAILDENAACFSAVSQTGFYSYGFVYRYSKPEQLANSDHELHDHRPFRWCCKEAPDGQRDFCKYYLEKRPLATSHNYDRLIPAMVHGNVHYQTFDGKTETFDGFGEYVAFSSMFQRPYLVLQTRHDIHPDTNKSSVYVSAVAMQVHSRLSPVVEIYSQSADDTLLTIVNGEAWTEGMATPPGIYMAAKDDTTGDHGLVVVYKEGMVLQVSINSSRLRTTLMLPKSYNDGRWQGLLGNADGYSDNDNPPGTNLERWSLQLVYGSSLLGSNANDRTLFALYGSPYISASMNIHNALSYYDIHWTPTTHLDLNNVDAADQAMCRPVNRIESNFPCIFDTHVSGERPLGLLTLQSELAFEELSKLFRDEPPRFDQRSDYVIQVRVGEPFTVRLVATKAGAEQLTFSASFRDDRFEQLDTDQKQLPTLEGEHPGTQEAVFTYTIDTVQGYLLSFVVEDEDGASCKLNVQIHQCYCKNGGKCEYGVSKDLGDCSSVASCACPPGWTGDDCGQDLDGCTLMPCYGGCTDVKPEDVQTEDGVEEFTCAACPADMDGDGENCYEVNECKLEEGDPHESRKHKCEQTCVDLPVDYYCMCKDGFILQEDNTCTDRSECVSPTLNTCDRINGKCLDNIPGTHTCVCEEGFTKLPNNQCADVNECIERVHGKPLHKCQQVCRNTNGAYECLCKRGYRTSTEDSTRCIDIDECAEDIDECDTFCTNTNGDYVCSCDDGFILQPDGCVPRPDKTCRPEHDICTRDPKASCSWIDNVATCHCKGGYRASDEEYPVCIDIDECMTNLHNCDDLADCVNINGSFSCLCKTGFAAAEGTTECNDVDECLDNPCRPGPCINTYGSYYCPCPENLDRAENGTDCIDRNECEAGQLNPCDQLTSTCRNLDGSHSCDCNQGFHKDADLCIPIIECPSDSCQDRCEDTLMGYRCFCSKGYTEDPQDKNKCIDIDECMLPDNSSRCTHTCLNTIGSYQCSCREHFTLDSADSHKCIPNEGCESLCGGGKCRIDVDGRRMCDCDAGYQQSNNFNLLAECTNINECSQNHGCERSQCQDQTPGYQCVPPQGYETTVNGLSSVDVDECIMDSHNCSTLTSTCRNTNGSYECVCNTGFHMLNGICTDVDECAKVKRQEVRCANYDIADCVNVPGSYFCRCKPGYRGNGTYCTDWDECSDEVQRCNRKTEVCVNGVGSFYCTCAPGYKLQWDAEAEDYTCQDIDECMSPTLNLCQPRERCVNKLGSFRCHCQHNEVPMNDGVTCQDKHECSAEDQRKCGDFVCRGGHCVCPYSKQGSATAVTCEDVNECLMDPCNPENSVCQNMDPDFRCTCEDAENAVPDQDGLGCIETNGDWGAWSTWSECTYLCAGKKSRHRVCDNPLGANRTCSPGASHQTKLCNDQDTTGSCKVRSITKCSFMDLNLPCEKFEEIEESLVTAISYALNNAESLHPYNETYKTYCKSEPRLDFDAEHLTIPSDIKLTGSYPRALDGDPSKSRVAICVTMDRFCSMYGASRTRRSLPEPGSSRHHHISRRDTYSVVGQRELLTNQTYFLPTELLQEVLALSNGSDSLFLAFLNDELYDARLRELIGVLDITVVEAYDEDQTITTTTPVPTLPPFTLPPWAIALIVIVSSLLIIIVVVLLILYCSKKKNANSGRISPSDE